MRILILNWRDTKNPLSGGAEILTQELAKRLVENGNDVTIFSSYFEGAKKEETIDGVKVIRQGHPDARTLFSSVQFKAFQIYRSQYRGQVDLVIDEFHGVPFFTPFYVKERKVALICEVAGSLWDMAVRPPFNYFGKFGEKLLPIIYHSIPIVTISDSSKEDLLKIGYSAKNVNIIPLGSNSKVASSIPKKEASPTLIFLSRLSKPKGVEDAIKATSILKEKYSKIRLWVLGRGPEEYKKKLKNLVFQLKLQDSVKFFDFVSEREKEDLLTKAHILLTPSVKEGWGLTVHEAGARGTPVVSYNSPGLRDVVKPGVNGVLTQKNNPEQLAKEVDLLIKDRGKYSRIQKGAISERKKYSWEKTYREFEQIITK